MFICSKNKYLRVRSSSVMIQIHAAKLCFALFICCFFHSVIYIMHILRVLCFTDRM